MEEVSRTVRVMWDAENRKSVDVTLRKRYLGDSAERAYRGAWIDGAYINIPVSHLAEFYDNLRTVTAEYEGERNG